MTNPSNDARPTIPWGLVRHAVWLPGGLWLALVLIPSLLGSPGAICLTPAGWLLGLWVGARVAGGTRIFETQYVTRTARQAGVVMGIAQGLIFTAIAVISPNFSQGEGLRSLVLGVILTLLGAGVSSMLAAWAARVITGRSVSFE
jgi:hypothetical protein